MERRRLPAREMTSAHAAVQRRRDEGYGEPEPHVLERLGVHDPAPRRHPDPACRDEDERALEAAGEVLGFVVPEGVLLVRRTRRVEQRPERRYRRDQVDHRLGRVGEQADGPRQKVGPQLEAYGQHRRRDGDHGVPAGRPAQRHVPFATGAPIRASRRTNAPEQWL